MVNLLSVLKSWHRRRAAAAVDDFGSSDKRCLVRGKEEYRAPGGSA
jgi:hypothetical protein